MKRYPLLFASAGILIGLTLLPSICDAQIHIIRANGVRLIAPSQIQNAEGMDSLISIDDPSVLFIALDYDNLTVTMTRNDDTPGRYAISEIVRRSDGLDCNFIDLQTHIRYELRYFYSHPVLNGPLMRITWNDLSPEANQYVILSSALSLF